MCHLIRLEQFHRQVATAVEQSPDKVISKLNALREVLTASSNVHVYLSCNTAQLDDIYGEAHLANVWKSCFKPTTIDAWPIFDPIEQLNNSCGGTFGKVTICALGGSESAFMQQVRRRSIYIFVFVECQITSSRERQTTAGMSCHRTVFNAMRRSIMEEDTWMRNSIRR